MGRRAILEGVDHVAEHGANLLVRQAERAEGPGLQVGVVNTDAAAAQLHAVQDDVIGQRPHLERIGADQVRVGRMRRSEGVIDRGQPALAVLLEQREIGDPGEREQVGRNDLGRVTGQQAQAAEGQVRLVELVRGEQHQVARLDAQPFLQARLLRFGKELHNRGLPAAVFLHPDEGKSAQAGVLGQRGPLVNHPGGHAGQPGRVDRLHHAAGGEHVTEDLELGGGEKVGEIGQQHAEPRIGLVRAVAIGRLLIGHARQGQRGPRPAGRHDHLGDQAVDERVDVVGRDERHLEVDLGELGLPVGAQVLVAEAARDLEVAVQAGHHAQLLVLLGRLRQRVEGAGVDAAGHQVVARPLGRALGQDGRLHLDERLAIQVVADGLGDLVPQHEVVLHLRTAQVQIAIGQAQVLGHLRRLLILQRERDGLGAVQDRDAMCPHLDAAGGQLAVHHLGRPLAHRALDPDHPLAAAGLGEAPRLGAILGIKQDLGQPVAVAQVNEDDAAVVAHGVHPAAEGHALADVGGPEFAAGVGSHHGSSQGSGFSVQGSAKGRHTRGARPTAQRDFSRDRGRRG